VKLGPLAAALALAACGPSPEAVERERILRAADALRDAPGPVASAPRRRLLEELERQPASAPSAARARDACASAYRHLFDGDDITLEIQRAVDRGEAERPDLPRKLQEAEAALAQARAQMPGCEQALADLRRPRR
jgi:hypothetical protein